MRSIPVFALLVLVAALAAFPGCKSAETAGGKLYFSQGLYDKAIAQLEPAVESNPNDYEAWLWLGRSYAEVGRYEDAAHALDQAANGPAKKKEVDNAREHYWIDQFNHGIGFVKEADAEADSSHTSKATAKYEQAEKAFSNAVVLKPGEAKGYIYQGYALSKLGRSDEALGFYQKAIELAPNDPEARRNLFATFKNLGDKAAEQRNPSGYEEAIRYYGKALELQPTNTSILFNEANSHFELARIDSNRTAEDRAAEFNAAAETYTKALRLFQAAEDSIKADTKLSATEKQQSLEQTQGDIENTLFNMNLAQYQAGDAKAAEQTARQLIALDPHKPDGYMLLSTALQKQGDSKAAVAERLVAQALEKGQVASVDNLEATIRKSYGNSSDALATLKSMGVPQEVRTGVESGVQYDVWFYWNRGQAISFSNGSKLGSVTFEPVKGS